jgi:uncharacterized membrane-anchored protein
MKKVLSIITIILLLFVVGYVIYSKTNVEDYTYVILKINPEVELGVDTKEIVREINPLNEDAELLLSDMNLLGKPLEEVTEEIIDSTVAIGKLENQIELMVMNKNEEKRLALETKLKTKIEAHVQTQNYNALLTVKGLTEEIKTDADTYEISYGKMLLISKAIELNSDLKAEELAKGSITEIQGYIKEVREEDKKETLKEKNITVDQLKEEYMQRKEELIQQNKPESAPEGNNQQESNNNNSTETQNQNGR